MNIAQSLRETARRLAEAGIEEATIEAELILCHVLAFGRTGLYLAGRDEFGEECAARLLPLLARRLRREPLAYILGEREFWGLAFTVSRDVLIPRPETELMLELALSELQKEELAGPVLDVGTGSGAIAVVAALEIGRPVVAVDISWPALNIARLNASRHGVAARISFLQADLAHLPFAGARFGAVFANLPYVAAGDILHLAPEVRDHEPRLALDGGPDGGDLIAALASQLPAVVRTGGRVYFEIGAEQEKLARDIFKRHGGYGEIVVHHDLAGLPRILAARVV